MRRRVRRAVLVTIAIFAAGVLTAMTGATASASPWIGVWIQSSFADACASIPSSADGAMATQESCADLSSQLWTFDDAGPSNTYRIRSLASGLCLTATGSSSGSPVQQFPCAGVVSQSWTLSGTGNTFRIINAASGHCLARSNTTLGSPLVHGTCTLLRAQWQLLY